MIQVLQLWVPYRPSSGTEGLMFYENWCSVCSRDRAFQNGNGRGCRIIVDALLYDKSGPNYPKEWVVRADEDSFPGSARCTAFAPLKVLSDRAREAWKTRRQKRRDSFSGDLFGGQS